MKSHPRGNASNNTYTPAEDESYTNTLLVSLTLQHVQLFSTDVDLAQDLLYDHHGKSFGARKYHGNRIWW